MFVLRKCCVVRSLYVALFACMWVQICRLVPLCLARVYVSWVCVWVHMLCVYRMQMFRKLRPARSNRSIDGEGLSSAGNSFAGPDPDILLMRDMKIGGALVGGSDLQQLQLYHLAPLPPERLPRLQAHVCLPTACFCAVVLMLCSHQMGHGPWGGASTLLYPSTAANHPPSPFLPPVHP